MKIWNRSNDHNLRRKAEAEIKNTPSKNSSLSEIDIQKLLHELEVHQVELEMQNQELNRAHSEISETLKLYKEYNSLYDFAPVGFLVLSQEGEISKLNLVGSQMIGIDRLKLLGSRFGFFVSNDTKPVFNEFFGKVFTNKVKESCEITILDSSNSTRHTLISGIAFENGKECLLTLVDITELNESKKRLLIAGKELASQNIEKEKRVAELIIANEEKEKRAEELIIANKELAFQNVEKEKRAEELIIANKELAFQNEEKEKRAEELIIANKELAFQNVEKEKRAEELIKAKEKAEESDRLKSAFLTNMSHEIRTPMNGILGFTELLKEPNLSSEEQQYFIENIQISGARMLDTINNIVDVSKIETGLSKVHIIELNINEKVESIYKFFKPEVELKGLQFLFKNCLTSKGAVIKTDNGKINGILTSLVKNAIKFTNSGSIEFGYEKKGEYLEFFVKDTGVGIPENQKELIFKSFRQGQRIK
jgi:signal transduction histidine kinase